MTIVCGTDFSPGSRATCENAAALARAKGANLVLVHALALPMMPEGVAADALQKMTDDAAAELSRMADALRKSHAIEVDARVESGDADEVIARIAGETAASLVVISATSKPKTRWLLGSTADRIASTVESPLLVLREGFPVDAWLAGKRPLRIAVASDLSPISENALTWAAELRKFGACTFVLLHVSWPPEAYRRFAIEGPMPLDRTHPIVEQVVRRELEDSAARLCGTEPCEIVIESSFGRPADSLNRLAKEANADVLLVGHHTDRLWSAWEGSVARAVMRTADMSVICIPDRVEAAQDIDLQPLERVVIATDLSRGGNAAIPYGLSVVAPGGHVTIVHVVEDASGDEERARIVEGLRGLALGPQLLERNVRVDVELLEGDERAQAIVAFAERNGADILCLGTSGRSALPRIVFGSVAQEVLLSSRIPVLLVPATRMKG